MKQNICYNCLKEKGDNSICPHCGYDDNADREKYPVALPHETILAGKYIIRRVLGQGGFGITYLAEEYQTNQLVAIKEYFPNTLVTRTATHSVSAFSGDSEENFRYGKACFLEEAKTLAEFIGNQNIVRVHKYFEENNTAYFVMEYIHGQSFKDYINNNEGKISFDEAKKILFPIMDALSAVHGKGIIHRDLSPDNIFISEDGTVKLIDFGAARYSLGDQSRSLDVVLKHGYAPFEQYTRRGKQGAFTDVYSLAATFYRAITGHIPPESVDRMENDQLVLPTSLGSDISAEAEDALLKGLEVMSADRFQSMQEFKEALSCIGNVQPASVIATTPDLQKNIYDNGKQNTVAINANLNSGYEAQNKTTDVVKVDNKIQYVYSQPEADKPLKGKKNNKKLTRKIITGVILGIASLIIIFFAVVFIAIMLDDDYEWSNYGNTIGIDNYIGLEQDLIIPSEINGMPVEQISDYAFSGDNEIESITIPDNIKYIGGNAFKDCTSLKSISIPDSVISIEEDAFANTAYYNDESNWENGVLYIDNCLIAAKEGEIPNNYVIRQGTKTIARNAFKGCTSLKSITIPDSVTNIGFGAFYETACYNDGSNWDNGVLYIGNHLIEATTDLMSDYTVKRGTKVIAEAAFYECTNLKSVTIPESVTSMGGMVFQGCEGLNSVIIANGVTSIRECAFTGCVSLNSITIPDSVTSIGYSAFENCESLKDIILPKNVTFLGSSVFSGCTSFESVYILGDNVIIGNYAFEDCVRLNNIIVPDSAVICYDVLKNTAYYTNGSNWANGVLYLGNHLIKADSSDIPIDYTVRQGTKTIATGAFFACVNLKSITIPDGVTVIGPEAFINCEMLESVEIPDSVTNIGYSAFEGCNKLKKVSIPSECKYYDDTFDSDTKVTER